MAANYEIRIGKCLKDAWNTFMKGPEVFVLLTVALFGLNFVLRHIPFVGVIFSFVIAAFSFPAFILVAEEIRHRGRSNGSCLYRLGELGPQLLMTYLIKVVFVTIGFFLLVVPGIYLVVVYTFSALFVILDNKPFWEALEASRDLVRGHWWEVFALNFLCFLILLAGFLVLLVGMLVAAPLWALLVHAVFLDIRSQLGEAQVVV